MKTNGWAIFYLTVIATALAQAQQREESTNDVPTRPRIVIARVNQSELLEAELRARLRQLPRIDDASRLDARRIAMLETLIRQELVLEYLRRRSVSASRQEVDADYRKWQEALDVRDLSPVEYFRRTGLDEDAIRRRLEWQIGWPRWVRRKLTDKTLEKYFEKRRREFDGTTMNVSHVFWSGDAVERSLFTTAADLRKQIVGGQLTFEEAASRHSQAPSARSGGVVGWIERNKPMHPEFSAAAFGLEIDEISEPVATDHGVHLIKCLEVTRGTRKFREVRPLVLTAARNDMFRTLASRERRRSKVRMHGFPQPVR